MIDRSSLAYLRYAHGLYNLVVILLFLYQGTLGLRIRRERLSGASPAFGVIKRHRKFGPVLVPLGIAGFLAGIAIAYLDEGEIFHHPLHFSVGLAIVVFISTTYIISRKIKSRDSRWRGPHFALGIIIICLYLIQAFLGIGILF